jgi:PAS domain S-box-containing protein
MEVMDGNVINAGNKIDILLSSSSTLMNKYLNSNQITNSAASRIIIIVLLFIMFSLVVGGFYYVKEITKPIENLALTAKNITQGNFALKAEVNQRTHDEIDNFANLFNNMINVLSETTVSRDYLNSILHKINEILVITDVDGKILIVNKAAIDLLEYKEKELIGEPIEKILLGENKKERTTLENETVQNIYNTYYSKSNLAIPVSFSKSFIFDKNNKKTGILYLANHQLNSLHEKQESTEKKDQMVRNIKLTGKIPLTNRELEIIKLIIKDYSSQEIAEKLFISIRTVETHRKHIMEKLHTKSIIALVKYAIQNGLAS